MRNNGGFRLQKANLDLRDYDDQGPLVAASHAGSLGFVYIYSGDELSLIRDCLGRELRFSYSGGRLGVQGGVARVVREQGSGCSACGEETGSSCEYGGRQQTARVRDGKGGITSSSHVDQGNLSRLVRRGSGYRDDQCGLELQPPSRVQGAGSGQRSFCTC